MKNLTRTICLALVILLGTTGTSWSADSFKGWAAYIRDDFPTDLNELLPLAEQGDVIAQFNVGLMYVQGTGVPQDNVYAHMWGDIAASSGNHGQGVALSAHLRSVPRILGLLDKNPISSTYGCLDRKYWQYKIIDFPCGMNQELVRPLAFVYKNKFPKNIFFEEMAVRSNSSSRLATDTYVINRCLSARVGNLDSPRDRGEPSLFFMLLCLSFESLSVSHLRDSD